MSIDKRCWLRDLREGIGLTQEEVALAVSISRSTYTKVELGYPVSFSTANKIGDYFNVSWTRFFEGRAVS